MKAFVTGGDGLLGTNLVRLLIDSGAETSVLVHPASKSRTLEGLNVTIHRGDLLDAGFVADAMKGSDTVFHIAASTAMWPPRDPMIWKVNVQGTVSVLDAASSTGVKRLVHVGSASSLGYGTKKKPGDENTPYKYEGFGLAYFDSKLEAQRIVLENVKQGRVDAVIVNPTFMLGPFDSGPSSGRLIVKYVEMNLPFYTPGGRNFIHVGDAAEGLLLACEKGKSGECYILGNRNLDMKEFLGIVSDIAGCRPPAIEIPEPVVKIAGAVGSMVADITGKTPEMTNEIAKASCIGSYYTAGKAVRELGLRQTPVEQAVEDSYRWLCDNGYIK